MRLLICGSRNWQRSAPIALALNAIHPAIVITGAARGADTMASTIARLANYTVAEYPANWEIEGKAAGPKRNQRMLDDGKPDLVLGFTENLGMSRGTTDMLSRAAAANVPTVHCDGRNLRLMTGAAITDDAVADALGRLIAAFTETGQDDGNTLLRKRI